VAPLVVPCEKMPLFSQSPFNIRGELSIFASIVQFLRPNRFIQLLLAILLIGASVNSCLPWKSLRQNLITLEFDDDQAQDGEEDREEKDERETASFDQDFTGMQSLLISLQLHENTWSLEMFHRLAPPVIDILIPPPKQVC
jgi:hypothetical protein